VTFWHTTSPQNEEKKKLWAQEKNQEPKSKKAKKYQKVTNKHLQPPKNNFKKVFKNVSTAAKSLWQQTLKQFADEY
jgi:hypothetical protein